MANLIDTSRAVQNANLAKLNASNPTYLASLVAAASAAIEAKCGRRFGVTSYTEYLSGPYHPGDALRLSNFPVQSITRVACDPRKAFSVRNSAVTTNQRATIRTTSTALILYRVASGTATTTTLTYATYVTLAALKTAVEAAGPGWTVLIEGGYENFPSADLAESQGAVSAIDSNGAELEVYIEDFVQAWRLDSSAGILYGGFPHGHRNIRVDYTAGVDDIPENLQQATVILSQHLHQLDSVQAGVQSRSIGPYSRTFVQPSAISAMPAAVLALISPYIDHSRTVGRE